ncbi:MAG: hypothetical protein IKH18_04185 [Clostridia bacterium]|nr:hypothetical protein [Clostridia bacterium]
MNGRAGRASALILALVLFFSAFLAPTSSLSDGSEGGAVYGVVQTFQLPDTLSGFFPGLKHPERPVHVYPSSLGSAPSYAGLAALSDVFRALGISVSVPEVNLPEYSTDLSDIWLGLASEPGVLMDKTRLLLDLRQLINLLLRPPMLIPVTPSFPEEQADTVSAVLEACLFSQSGGRLTACLDYRGDQAAHLWLLDGRGAAVEDMGVITPGSSTVLPLSRCAGYAVTLDAPPAVPENRTLTLTQPDGAVFTITGMMLPDTVISLKGAPDGVTADYAFAFEAKGGWQPDSPLTVTLTDPRVAETLASGCAVLLRAGDAEGQLREIPFTADGDTASFVLDHLGTVLIDLFEKLHFESAFLAVDAPAVMADQSVSAVPDLILPASAADAEIVEAWTVLPAGAQAAVTVTALPGAGPEESAEEYFELWTVFSGEFTVAGSFIAPGDVFDVAGADAFLLLRRRMAPRQTSAEAGDGSAVTVSGSLPAGTVLALDPVPVSEAFAVAAGEEYEPVLAFDLFLSLYGKDYQPEGPVAVTVQAPALAALSESGLLPSVFHIPDNGGSPVEMRVLSFDGDTLVFETDHFSTYVITSSALQQDADASPDILEGQGYYLRGLESGTRYVEPFMDREHGEPWGLWPNAYGPRFAGVYFFESAGDGLYRVYTVLGGAKRWLSFSPWAVNPRYASVSLSSSPQALSVTLEDGVCRIAYREERTGAVYYLNRYSDQKLIGSVAEVTARNRFSLNPVVSDPAGLDGQDRLLVRRAAGGKAYALSASADPADGSALEAVPVLTESGASGLLCSAEDGVTELTLWHFEADPSDDTCLVSATVGGQKKYLTLEDVPADSSTSRLYLSDHGTRLKVWPQNGSIFLLNAEDYYHGVVELAGSENAGSARFIVYRRLVSQIPGANGLLTAAAPAERNYRVTCSVVPAADAEPLEGTELPALPGGISFFTVAPGDASAWPVPSPDGDGAYRAADGRVLRFAGWTAENGVTVAPGETADLRALDADGDRSVALSSRWETVSVEHNLSVRFTRFDLPSAQSGPFTVSLSSPALSAGAVIADTDGGIHTVQQGGRPGADPYLELTGVNGGSVSLKWLPAGSYQLAARADTDYSVGITLDSSGLSGNGSLSFALDGDAAAAVTLRRLRTVIPVLLFETDGASILPRNSLWAGQEELSVTVDETGFVPSSADFRLPEAARDFCDLQGIFLHPGEPDPARLPEDIRNQTVRYISDTGRLSAGDLSVPEGSALCYVYRRQTASVTLVNRAGVPLSGLTLTLTDGEEELLSVPVSLSADGTLTERLPLSAGLAWTLSGTNGGYYTLLLDSPEKTFAAPSGSALLASGPVSGSVELTLRRQYNSLTVTEISAGDMSMDTDAFPFTLTAVSSSGETVSSFSAAVQAVITRRGGAAEQVEIRFENGVARNAFLLSSGDSIRLNALYAPWIRVSEEHGTYSASWQITDGSAPVDALSSDASSVTLSLPGSRAVTVTNTLEPVSPTGVKQDALPFLLLALSALMLLSLPVFSRLRKKK